MLTRLLTTALAASAACLALTACGAGLAVYNAEHIMMTRGETFMIGDLKAPIALKPVYDRMSHDHDRSDYLSLTRDERRVMSFIRLGVDPPAGLYTDRVVIQREAWKPGEYPYFRDDLAERLNIPVSSSKPLGAYEYYFPEPQHPPYTRQQLANLADWVHTEFSGEALWIEGYYDGYF